MNTTSYNTLLEQIIVDSGRVPFPVETIRSELVHLFLSQIEFDYFIQQAHRVLKNTHGNIIAAIFLQVLRTEMKLEEDNVYQLDVIEYFTRIEKVIETLESIKITIIPKDSPDYELVMELSKI